jgi:hypothetical protein
MMSEELNAVRWVGSSQKNVQTFPPGYDGMSAMLCMQRRRARPLLQQSLRRGLVVILY